MVIILCMYANAMSDSAASATLPGFVFLPNFSLSLDKSIAFFNTLSLT